MNKPVPPFLGENDDEPVKIFDIAEGRQRRDASMAAAETHAHRYWKVKAFESVLAVATRMKYFTTDFVHEELLTKHPEAQTHEPRALGPVVREVQSLGLIRQTKEFWKSERPVAHRNPKRVWRSLTKEFADLEEDPDWLIYEYLDSHYR